MLDKHHARRESPVSIPRIADLVRGVLECEVAGFVRVVRPESQVRLVRDDSGTRRQAGQIAERTRLAEEQGETGRARTTFNEPSDFSRGTGLQDEDLPGEGIHFEIDHAADPAKGEFLNRNGLARCGRGERPDAAGTVIAENVFPAEGGIRSSLVEDTAYHAVVALRVRVGMDGCFVDGGRDGVAEIRAFVALPVGPTRIVSFCDDTDFLPTGPPHITHPELATCRVDVELERVAQTGRPDFRADFPDVSSGNRRAVIHRVQPHVGIVGWDGKVRLTRGRIYGDRVMGVRFQVSRFPVYVDPDDGGKLVAGDFLGVEVRFSLVALVTEGDVEITVGTELTVVDRVVDGLLGEIDKRKLAGENRCLRSGQRAGVGGGQKGV